MDNHYIWAYQVSIENLRKESIQLLKRTWHITDGQGTIHEVSGQGVVGEQPIIEPGETYQYTSGTPLSTPSGIMEGIYYIKTKDGQMLEIEIPTFSLDSPFETASFH